MTTDMHFEVVGRLPGPEGDLWVGRLPESGFVVLSLEPYRVMLFLDPVEAERLAKMFGSAGFGAWYEHEAGRRDGAECVGVLRPRPLELQVTARQIPQGPAVGIILRQRTMQMLVLPCAKAEEIATWLGAAAAAEAPHALPPIEGELLGAGEGGLRLRSNGVRELRFLEFVSSATGRFGEFVLPSELPVGTRVQARVWEAPDGPPIAVHLQVMDVPEPPVSRPGTRQEWIDDCAIGNEMNAHLRNGDLSAARGCVTKLVDRIQGRDRVHAWFMAKTTLAHLWIAARVEDGAAAHAIWTENTGNRFFSHGIKMIEAGQLHDRDLLTYCMIEAWLHSGGPVQAKALEAVDQKMQMVHDMAMDRNERDLAALALRNWKLLLNDVCQAEPSPSVAARWRKCCTSFGSTPTDKILCFPLPEPWAVDWDEAGDKEFDGRAGAPPAPPREPVSSARRAAAPTRIPKAPAALGPMSAGRVPASTRRVLLALAALALVIGVVLGGMRWLTARPTGARFAVTHNATQLEREGTVIARKGESVEGLFKLLGQPSERLSPQQFHFGFYVFDTPTCQVFVRVEGSPPGSIMFFEVRPLSQ